MFCQKTDLKLLLFTLTFSKFLRKTAANFCYLNTADFDKIVVTTLTKQKGVVAYQQNKKALTEEVNLFIPCLFH